MIARLEVPSHPRRLFVLGINLTCPRIRSSSNADLTSRRANWGKLVRKKFREVDVLFSALRNLNTVDK
jgi:hypothetical protein